MMKFIDTNTDYCRGSPKSTFIYTVLTLPVPLSVFTGSTVVAGSEDGYGFFDCDSSPIILTNFKV